jgi:hypothetical protein
MQEIRITWAFLAIRENERGVGADLTTTALALLGGAPAHARYGGLVHTNTLDQAKMLVFLSRCSNAIAVFAIPRARHDIATHSN